MGIRQTLNENPAISATATAAVIVIAIAFIVWQLFGNHRTLGPGANKAFYSDDDGKTYFVDDVNKVTPFADANGKMAVQAFVFKCADGQPFVAYLTQYSEEGKKAAADPSAPRGGHGNMMMIEVKKPGAKSWIKFTPNTARQFTEAQMPKCPDGSTTGLRPVLPGS